jgi:hypothetical protein
LIQIHCFKIPIFFIYQSIFIIIHPKFLLFCFCIHLIIIFIVLKFPINHFIIFHSIQRIFIRRLSEIDFDHLYNMGLHIHHHYPIIFINLFILQFIARLNHPYQNHLKNSMYLFIVLIIQRLPLFINFIHLKFYLFLHILILMYLHVNHLLNDIYYNYLIY